MPRPLHYAPTVDGEVLCQPCGSLSHAVPIGDEAAEGLLRAHMREEADLERRLTLVREQIADLAAAIAAVRALKARIAA